MNFFRRLRSDRASSDLVAVLFVLPLTLGILLTIVDSSIFFTNRSLITTAARDGARTVAIMGGNGTASQQTPIEKQYGSKTACRQVSGASGYRGDMTVIECNVLLNLSKSKGLTNVKIKDVRCTPSVTEAVGTSVACNVGWDFVSVASSPLVFIKYGDTKQIGCGTSKNCTVATAQSEVALPANSLVDRTP